MSEPNRDTSTATSDPLVGFAVISLSIITGGLAILPWNQSPWAVLLGAALGAIIGYRRRSSRIFMYFLLVAVLALANTILNSTS
jgi:hypothetical protein